MADPAVWRVVRGGVLAAALAALSQLVIGALKFSHDSAFIAALLDDAVVFWVAWLIWAGLLYGRFVVDPHGTMLVLEKRVFGPVLGGLLVALATPFLNAYFTHFTHPLLAVGIVWVCWPLIGTATSRLRHHAWVARVADGAAFGRVGGGPSAPWVAGALCFGVVFVQSYRRHVWFGSGGKDLGLFHQSVWLLSKLESPDNTVMGMNAFADHMELIDLAAAPLQWLWPSAGSLLLFQALIVGLGAVPVFMLARDRVAVAGAGWAMAAVYLMAIDMQHAVMFDWNPTTCGVALMPWAVWAFHSRKRALFFAVVLLVALSKENLAVYATGLCLALAVGARDGRRRWALVAAAGTVVLFVAEIGILFPLMRSGGFRHFRFEQLGSGPIEAAGTLVRNPYVGWALLFTPGAKINGLLAPLSTVAFVCVLAPRYVLALAPMVLERFWSSHANRWWGHHYGAGAAVVVTLATIAALVTLISLVEQRRPPDRSSQLVPMVLATVVVACVLVASAGRFGVGPLMVWRHAYYTTATDRADTIRALEKIPDDRSVAAQNHLLPHLSARRQIYEITRPIEAEFVALNFSQSAWPFDRRYPRVLAAELSAAGYGVIACEGTAVVLRRASGSLPCPALLLP